MAEFRRVSVRNNNKSFTIMLYNDIGYEALRNSIQVTCTLSKYMELHRLQLKPRQCLHCEGRVTCFDGKALRGLIGSSYGDRS